MKPVQYQSCFHGLLWFRRLLWFRFLLGAAILLTMFGPVLASGADTLDFAKDIRPVLQEKCFRCHGNRVQKGELNLQSLDGILRGGESGRIISAGKPGESDFIEKIASGEMPPKGEGELSESEKALLHSWVKQGATIPGVDWKKGEAVTEHTVNPILLLRCATCHGRQIKRGDLDVRSVASLLKGGKSGPAIVPGDPAASLLLKRIVAEEMPPRSDLAKYSVKPMAANELEVLRQWISAGAPESATAVATKNEPINSYKEDPLVTSEDRSFWSFRPVQSVTVPEISSADTAIDAFVARRHNELGLGFSTSANAVQLIRRAHFDLLGLPPKPSDVRQFELEFERHPELAWTNLIERLLASPRYGERWGQYWLDLAGYSDSEGVQHADPIRPHVYRYRDYVIRAFNDDKPYNRFLLEQLAGDELTDYENAETISSEVSANLVATAFLKLSPDGTFAGITGFVPDRLEAIDDSLEVFSSAVIGLTVRCARCHSHKFDPIPQRDYYRLKAVFKSALDEHDWLHPVSQSPPAGIGIRQLPYVTTQERESWERHNSEIDQQVAKLKESKAAEDAIKKVESQRRPQPLIRALWDRGEPSPTYILRRGSYLTPGRIVSPGVPSALMGGDNSPAFKIEAPSAESKKTGRRLALARWAIDPRNPLTARVMANRIWKHHFGRGLVSTLDDFGKAGAKPTHPELLDWLASEFVRSGWSVKQMHRLMMTSTAYRQSSKMTAEHRKLDSENKWFARMPLRKLDAESLRDTLLTVADRLSHTPFGPADEVQVAADGLITSANRDGAWRRSIYVLKRRTQPLTILASFDRPRMSPNCISRPESTVATQALHLMNNKTVYELAEAFAARVATKESSLNSKVRSVYRLALSRQPTEMEEAIGVSQLSRLEKLWNKELQSKKSQPAEASPESPSMEATSRALVNYCHAFINSAAFLYVD
jgi:mono/diheme cytochrome c family protein